MMPCPHVNSFRRHILPLIFGWIPFCFVITVLFFFFFYYCFILTSFLPGTQAGLPEVLHTPPGLCPCQGLLTCLIISPYTTNAEGPIPGLGSDDLEPEFPQDLGAL